MNPLRAGDSNSHYDLRLSLFLLFLLLVLGSESLKKIEEEEENEEEEQEDNRIAAGRDVSRDVSRDVPRSENLLPFARFLLFRLPLQF